jgi:hypothetical protein
MRVATALLCIALTPLTQNSIILWKNIQLPLTGLGDVYLLLTGLGDVYPNNDRAAEKNRESGVGERTKLSVAQAS